MEHDGFVEYLSVVGAQCDCGPDEIAEVHAILFKIGIKAGLAPAHVLCYFVLSVCRI